MEGLGMVLASVTKRLMASWSEPKEWRTPRFRRRLASLAKNPSIALIQDAEAFQFRLHREPRVMKPGYGRHG
jgi:hypothetical protein